MTEPETKPYDFPPTSPGFQFLVLILVMMASGIGCKLGEYLAGSVGFWVVGSLAGIVVSLGAGFYSGKFQARHWPFWVLGPIGCLVGVQFSRYFLATENEGSRNALDFLGAFAGVAFAGALATILQGLVSRLSSPVQDRA